MDTDGKSPPRSRGWINIWVEKANNAAIEAYPSIGIGWKSENKEEKKSRPQTWTDATCV